MPIFLQNYPLMHAREQIGSNSLPNWSNYLPGEPTAVDFCYHFLDASTRFRPRFLLTFAYALCLYRAGVLVSAKTEIRLVGEAEVPSEFFSQAFHENRTSGN